MNVFIHCCDSFTQQSAVLDGASALLFRLFETELGKHARVGVDVVQLPRNACVGLDALAVLNSTN